MNWPFNYEGVERTCLWCGRKLRRYRHRDAEHNKGTGKEWGDYGDGHFCGLNCGYMFGRRLADLGKRLVKVGEGK